MSLSYTTQPAGLLRTSD